MNKELEKVSAEIHKCYCRAYERRFGKPYWTNGDYSKLDEPTKDYDREMATWHIAEVKKAVVTFPTADNLAIMLAETNDAQCKWHDWSIDARKMFTKQAKALLALLHENKICPADKKGK